MPASDRDGPAYNKSAARDTGHPIPRKETPMARVSDKRNIENVGVATDVLFSRVVRHDNGTYVIQLAHGEVARHTRAGVLDRLNELGRKFGVEFFWVGHSL